MRNILVMPNSYKDPGFVYTHRILSTLQRLGARVFLHASLKNEIPLSHIHYYDKEFPKEAEMILVIGGDGSMLDAAVYSLGADLPLLGINLGRLGYLAELEPGESEELSRLILGDYSIREHITLSVSLIRGGEEMNLVRHAINDVVLGQGGGEEGMSEILLEDGVGHHLNYLADGIIVATPLGSTAYSLAAGGPVIDASLSAFCVTPICAHSLFSRSVLFPSDYTLILKNTSGREGKMRVTIDGGESYLLSSGDAVKIVKSDKPLRMITLKNPSALGVLCRKMQLLNPKT